MPTPLPNERNVVLTPPDADETVLVYRGVAAAVAAPGGLTPLQMLLLDAIFRSMTGYPAPAQPPPPLSPAELADALSRRDLAFRTRIVQIMLLAALVLDPLPAPVADRIRAYTQELGVDDDMIAVTQAYAAGSLDFAAADFARNGYLAALDPGRLKAIHAQALNQSWEGGHRRSGPGSGLV